MVTNASAIIISKVMSIACHSVWSVDAGKAIYYKLYEIYLDNASIGGKLNFQ
jgi:hypothetical protein